MREDAAKRAKTYIENMTMTLAHLKPRILTPKISKEQVDKIIDVATRYTNDAEHYAIKEQPVTSLACVTYAEGLLDALKLLDLIEL